MFESICAQAILEVVLLRHPDGRSRGCAFVHVTTANAAVTLISKLDGTSLPGFPALSLSVKIARKEGLLPSAATMSVRADGGDRRKLFVGMLPFAFGEAEIESIFSPFGKITDIKLFLNPATGQSKGAAFVKFDTNENAHNALLAMNGQVPMQNELWKPLRITVAR